MYEIHIPKAICPSFSELQDICSHYDCEAVMGNRYNSEWLIQSESPTNFFWLGANIHNKTFNKSF